VFNVMMRPEDYLEGVSRVLNNARNKREKKLAANPQADVSELDFEISNLEDGYDYVLENIEIWRREKAGIYYLSAPVAVKAVSVKDSRRHEPSLFDLSFYPV